MHLLYMPYHEHIATLQPGGRHAVRHLRPLAHQCFIQIRSRLQGQETCMPREGGCRAERDAILNEMESWKSMHEEEEEMTGVALQN